MSTGELRKLLIEKIEKIDDERLLEEAFRLLATEPDAPVYKLTDKQRQAIDEAKEQIRNGEYLTNEQANDEINGWLKE